MAQSTSKELEVVVKRVSREGVLISRMEKVGFGVVGLSQLCAENISSKRAEYKWPVSLRTTREKGQQSHGKIKIWNNKWLLIISAKISSSVRCSLIMNDFIKSNLRISLKIKKERKQKNNKKDYESWNRKLPYFCYFIPRQIFFSRISCYL